MPGRPNAFYIFGAALLLTTLLSSVCVYAAPTSHLQQKIQSAVVKKSGDDDIDSAAADGVQPTAAEAVVTDNKELIEENEQHMQAVAAGERHPAAPQHQSDNTHQHHHTKPAGTRRPAAAEKAQPAAKAAVGRPVAASRRRKRSLSDYDEYADEYTDDGGNSALAEFTAEDLIRELSNRVNPELELVPVAVVEGDDDAQQPDYVDGADYFDDDSQVGDTRLAPIKRSAPILADYGDYADDDDGGLERLQDEYDEAMQEPVYAVLVEEPDEYDDYEQLDYDDSAGDDYGQVEPVLQEALGRQRRSYLPGMRYSSFYRSYNRPAYSYGYSGFGKRAEPPPEYDYVDYGDDSQAVDDEQLSRDELKERIAEILDRFRARRK